MKLLENIGFNAKEIAEMEDSIPSLIMEELNKEERLVLNNINILKELDINNYLLIFKNYYEMFLMDSSVFKDVFEKYDNDDLIDKINKNIAIIEHL